MSDGNVEAEHGEGARVSTSVCELKVETGHFDSHLNQVRRSAVWHPP